MVLQRTVVAARQQQWPPPTGQQFSDVEHRMTEIPMHAVEEPLPLMIQTVKEDLDDLKQFYNITISPNRTNRIERYIKEKLVEMANLQFDKLSQTGKADYVLLKNYLQSSLQRSEFEKAKDEKVLKFLGSFPVIIIELCEARQQVKKINLQQAAAEIANASLAIANLRQAILDEVLKKKPERTIAYRAAYKLKELSSILSEWYNFYAGYEPLFTCLSHNKLVGIEASNEDPIIGEPIGRDGILADLDFEKIAYTPEELIGIGEREYVWCEKEIVKASHDLGYGTDWRKALEHVKDMYVEPGQQIYAIRDLAVEATEYVKKHDLVTVPAVAESWRMEMIPPALQKVNPFFLGGPMIQVSYPTDTMTHEEKLMSMRGNSIPLSRSTVFHELIPGHHLQFHMVKRYRPYRRIFDTPFWMEGWSLYWEFILWDKGFPGTPENRIGMLFWRMHRCARIIFSLKFHMHQMTVQECIDLLVNKVGHERATAEGEVRRSFNGDYTPLYQAGYMLGALQLYALRKEVVETGKMSEKQFHDRVLQENEMPIEVLRALICEHPIDPEFKASWKFYGHDLEH